MTGVAGVAAVVAGLRRVADRLGDLSPATDDAGDTLAGIARDLAPVESGRLVSSIRAQGDRDGLVVVAGEGLEYAGVQNYGWPARNIEGTGFMTRAEEQAERVTAREVESELDRAIRSAGLAD